MSLLMEAPPVRSPINRDDHPTCPFPGVEYFGDEYDWLAARRTGIGASEIAGIFGVGYKNQSAVSVYTEKVSGPSLDEIREESERLACGKDLEPGLRRIFSRKTKLPCYTDGGYSVVRSATHPFLLASLDAWTEDAEGLAVVELKNQDYFAAKDWADDAEPPIQYQVQIQSQMFCTGTDHGYLFALIGGNRPVVKPVRRNDSFIAAMLQRLADFWGYVERRELPPVDASEATAAALARLWPEDSGRTVFAPAEAANWFRELEEAKAEIKVQEERETLAANKIKAAAGDASYIEAGGYRYSWKQQSRTEKPRRPEDCKTTTFRVLRKCK